VPRASSPGPKPNRPAPGADGPRRVVAQSCTLLYRRFVIGRRKNFRGSSNSPSRCRMKFCDWLSRFGSFGPAALAFASLRQCLSPAA
jgi:hypothetical protein